jgi:RND family efflux transporter MFP subunit
MRPYARVLTAFACAAALVSACGHDSPEEVETETIVPVGVASAEQGSILASIHATGDVNPAPGAELIVTAPEAARISSIPKGEGERVRRGEVLVRFEIPTLSADATSKGAELAAAETRVKTTRENQTRLHDLYERGVAARKDVEDADQAAADAEAALAQAHAIRGSAVTLASRQTIAATFDGVIAKRWHNPGDLVEPGASDPVLRVIDPARLQVDASVAIPHLARVVVGAAGRLILPDDAAPVPLKVIGRPAAVEPGTAAAPVRLAFLQPHTFAAGTPVEVEIDAEEHANVVLVPTPAIVREGEETAVFVVSNNKAQRRRVVLGIVNGTRAEIREGIKPGEQVIVRGQTGLPDGAAVTIEKS